MTTPTARDTEARWLQWVRDQVAAAGGHCWHPHDSRRSEPGWPDLSIVVGGRFMLRELKVGRYRTTPEQDETLELLRGAGQDADVWRFPDDVGRVLSELGLTAPADPAPVPRGDTEPRLADPLAGLSPAAAAVYGKAVAAGMTPLAARRAAEGAMREEVRR